MSPLERIPYAQPLQAIEPVRGIEPANDTGQVYGVESARDIEVIDAIEPMQLAVPGSFAHPMNSPRPQTDRLAIGSAMMSMFGFIPVVCQVIGLALGAMSLVRIRRAKRRGIMVTGTKWAVAGLAGNGLLLVCWVGIFAVMIGLRAAFSHSSETLQALTPMISQ